MKQVILTSLLLLCAHLKASEIQVIGYSKENENRYRHNSLLFLKLVEGVCC